MAQPPKQPRQSDRDLSAALALVEQLRPALMRGDRVMQNHIVERLIELSAPMGDQWQALANLALSNGELSLAGRAIDLFVEARRGEPTAQYQKAALLEQSGKLREAYELMCALPGSLPNPAANAFSRGTAALFLGEQPGHVRRAEQEHFREAVQIRVPGEQGEAHGGVRPGGRQQENRGRPGVGGAGGRVHAGPPAAGALPAAWPSATVRMWFVWPSRARTAAVTR